MDQLRDTMLDCQIDPGNCFSSRKYSSIVEDRNDDNAPVRRLEQPRDVMVTDTRVRYYWTEIRSRSMGTTL